MTIYRTALVKQEDGGVWVFHMANWFQNNAEAAQYLKDEYNLQVVKMFRGYINKNDAENWLSLNRKNLYKKFMR